MLALHTSAELSDWQAYERVYGLRVGVGYPPAPDQRVTHQHARVRSHLPASTSAPAAGDTEAWKNAVAMWGLRHNAALKQAAERPREN